MKNILVTLLFSFVIMASTASAQKYYFYGKVDPIETTFTQDSIMFTDFISQFSMRCQQYDTLLQFEWFNPLNNPERAQMDTRYEKFLIPIPLFKVFPAFRIDCPQGYVLCTYNHYINQQSVVNYLDILSYTLEGKMISRLSLAKFTSATYVTDDFKTSKYYQLISSTNIINGEIHYFVDQRSYTSIDTITKSTSTYIYKIQDDATLKLISEEHQQE